jgi:hypothetical protein
MESGTAEEIILEHMEAENSKKDVWLNKKVKVTGEFALMMNCRLCVEN